MEGARARILDSSTSGSPLDRQLGAGTFTVEDTEPKSDRVTEEEGFKPTSEYLKDMLFCIHFDDLAQGSA